MLRLYTCLMLVIPACATESVELEQHACIECEATDVSASDVSATDEKERRAPMPRVDGPERCEAAARARLPSSADAAWRALWQCVADGQFTALRLILEDPWDHELRTQKDAPLLLARVIAERGGNVESDLRLLHERRLALFTLSQALDRPALYRGALVIVRARASAHGLLDETRLVGQPWDVPVSPTERVTTRAAAPFAAETERLLTRRRDYNLDVATGTRALAGVERDPFIDSEDPLVILGRFDGLRDSDGWPLVTVLDHFRPSATVAY
jgi:hypothetical protein